VAEYKKLIKDFAVKVTTAQFLCIGYGSSGFTHGMRDLFGGGILDLKIF